ncbi:hypothetical protein [Dietzia sp. ANT_WB102]|uniref:hypothetical protein n=1 Tax=Dietzia sp. ANT_WB102 TaxID=2597345 RepID=UPI0011EE1461|nr:hypothetical protein [Dietzia sp. ANT_WB102]KAA0919256.1 hypothetical protein FQ137_08345 [Dietzia sp. ANT_WB102]
MSPEGDHTADSGGAEPALYIENGDVLVSGPTEAALTYVVLKDGLIPTKDGVHTFLGMTRSGSQISHHLRFTGVAASPAQLLSIQVVAVQLALRIAIAGVIDSIKRMEGAVSPASIARSSARPTTSVATNAESGRHGRVRGVGAIVSHVW